MKSGVPNGDRRLIRELMKLIESKTCVKFNEFPSSNTASGIL